MTRLEKECRMQALVTRREGMIVENRSHEAEGYSYTPWPIGYFEELADQLAELAKEPEEP